MKLIALLLLLAMMVLIQPSVLSSQTLVELNDGSQLVGEVVEQREDSLFLRLAGGEVVGFSGESISYMGPVEKKSSIAQYYPVIGIVVGTPGILNFMVGFYTPFLSVRAGGMPMIVKGFQLDLGYPLVRQANISLDLYGCYGTSNLGEFEDNRDRTYLGIGGSIRYYVGFLSLGARYDLHVKDVGPMVQLGVLHEFTQ